MKFNICAVATALILVCLATAAGAAKKPAAPSGLRAIQIECMKQWGAYEDPQTKKLMIQGSVDGVQAQIDAIYKCVGQKTGKPAAPFMNQDVRYR
jgi:hypothetical protein